ncbi:uncharacterized protein LOC117101232 [Anneissia japonica]|uniref:uncharacterized protein LOC117101232 n=1 Tax=Anneissia japonica TaxID=1529436 RepID=UPI0014256767|nr:uncharacterized protein LOC117101232 [Anneissia japonica]XP_033098186.1 uncharacterized protein LOC117101232 [Anneissia japonica]
MLSNTNNSNRIWEIIRGQDPCMVPVYQDDSGFPSTLVISKDGNSSYLRAIVFGTDSSVTMDILEIPSDCDFSDVSYDQKEHYTSSLTKNKVCDLPEVFTNKQPPPPNPVGVNRNAIFPEDHSQIGNTVHRGLNGTTAPKNMANIFEGPTPAGYGQTGKSLMLRRLLERESNYGLEYHQKPLPQQTLTHSRPLVSMHTGVSSKYFCDDINLARQCNGSSSVDWRILSTDISMRSKSTGDEDKISTISEGAIGLTAHQKESTRMRQSNYRPLSHHERQNRYLECLKTIKRRPYKRKLKLVTQELATPTQVTETSTT